MADVDRRAVRVILALCGLDFGEFADCIGYERGSVSNVLTGQARPSAAFRRAFGDTVAQLVFGETRGTGRALPAAPLIELVQRRARYAHRKGDFYADHGINMSYLNSREYVTEAVVDRICSSLGVHPSALYGNEQSREAS